jgi:transposase
LSTRDITELLGDWEGYRIGAVGRYEAGELGDDCPSSQVWIELKRKPGPMICSGCGQPCDKIHDWQERWVRDLPILDAQTHLCVQRFRVACPTCGPKVERLSWLELYARVTNRLAESVFRLCRDATVQAAAEFYGLGWDTAKAIDKVCLQRTLGEPDLSNVKLLALDEFAVKKGRRYATIFVEPTRKQVLWACPGNGREDIRPFFEKLGEEGRRRIQAVAMDMHRPYEAEVQA